MTVSVATEWLRNAKSSPSELCNELWQAGFELQEDTCAGAAVVVRDQGRPVDAARCSHWDQTNAECSIDATLKADLTVVA